MRQLIRKALMLLGCVFGQAVAAQDTLVDFVYPVRPEPGVYYDPTQSGTGLTVDSVGLANGGEFVFSTFYHYGADATPEWMNFGAPLAQQSLVDYTASGVPAVLRGQWNYSRGGQCFDCAHAVNTVSTPPYGERRIEVIGGRHLRMPASGNAAALNMKLGKMLKPGGVMSEALLADGSVWSVKFRSPDSGTPIVYDGGWIRFKKRTGTSAADRAVFTGFEAGVAPVPAFLDVQAKNEVNQYEAACVRGSCGQSIILDSVQDGYDSQSVTFLVDPSNDRIRMYQRCVTGATGACPPTQPSLIKRAGDVIYAGRSSDGQPRLVIRLFWMTLGGWHYEYELTRVSADLISYLYPNGLPQQ